MRGQMEDLYFSSVQVLTEFHAAEQLKNRIVKHGWFTCETELV